jgi:nucleotide-binding universal stress UspA family protein
MKPIKNILVPTDFSEAAQNALIYAIKFSRMANATLTVLHAYHVPIAAVGAEYPVYNGPYADEIESEVQAKFYEIKRNYLYADLPEHTFISRLGMAEEVIQNAAESSNFDLIIMGTHGGNALQEVIGSTTSDIIKKLPLPILAIPPGVI